MTHAHMLHALVVAVLFSHGAVAEMLHRDLRLSSEHIQRGNNAADTTADNDVRELAVCRDPQQRASFRWVATSWDGRIAINNGADGVAELRELLQSDTQRWARGAIDSVSVSPDGQLIAAFEEHGNICIIDADSEAKSSRAYWLPLLCINGNENTFRELRGLRIVYFQWMANPECLVVSYEDGRIIEICHHTGICRELSPSSWVWESASHELFNDEDLITIVPSAFRSTLTADTMKVCNTLTQTTVAKLLARTEQEFLLHRGTQLLVRSGTSENVLLNNVVRSVQVDKSLVVVTESLEKGCWFRGVNVRGGMERRAWKCERSVNALWRLLCARMVDGNIVTLWRGHQNELIIVNGYNTGETEVTDIRMDDLTHSVLLAATLTTDGATVMQATCSSENSLVTVQPRFIDISSTRQ
jgi:hypothetical protein